MPAAKTGGQPTCRVVGYNCRPKEQRQENQHDERGSGIEGLIEAEADQLDRMGKWIGGAAISRARRSPP